MKQFFKEESNITLAEGESALVLRKDTCELYMPSRPDPDAIMDPMTVILTGCLLRALNDKKFAVEMWTWFQENVK